MRKILAVACLLAVVCVTANAGGYTAMVKQYREPRLGGSTPGSGFKVSVGHIKFELTSGTVSVVLAGDETVGLFLEGAGTFSYLTENGDELTALRYNAKHGGVDVQIAEASATVAGTFKSVVLRGNGLPVIDPAATGAPPAERFGANRAEFVRQKYAEPAEYLFVLQKANAPSARLVRAEILGIERPFVYVYDEVWRQEESLSSLHPPTARGPGDADWLSATPLSRQAIGRSNRTAAPQNAIITDLDVNLVNTSGENASLTVVETIVPRRPLRAMLFDLYSDYIFDLY